MENQWYKLQLPAWDAPLWAHGNTNIAQMPLTAFLCSRRYPAVAVLRSYHWAQQMRAAGAAVISGFHSPLERDVLDLLLKGTQPVAIALARGLQKRYPAAVGAAMAAGRLLALSPFAPAQKRINRATIAARNRLIAAAAQNIVIGFEAPGGNIARVLAGASGASRVQRLHPAAASAGG